MLERALTAAIMSAMLLTCSTRAEQNQAVTKIALTPSPVCPRPSSEQARQTTDIYTDFAPNPAPQVFALHFGRGWEDQPGIPQPLQLPQNAIRVTLKQSENIIKPSPIRVLGSSALPSALEQFCRSDDGGVTYLYGIDEADLAQGFYNIDVSAPQNPEVHARKILVYVAPKQNALPALRIGQEYLVLPPPSDAGVKALNIEYEDAAQGAIPFQAISLHIARIISLDTTSVTVAVAQTQHHLREPRSGNSPALLGLVPILDDPSQRAMESWYAGKRVWTRGHLQNLCASKPGLNIDWPSNVIARVQHVYRVDVPFFELALGHNIGASGYGRDSGFESSSPLLVTLTPKTEGDDPTRCADPFLFFADAWDMQRALSTSSVRQAHPDWPPTMLDAIEQGRVQVGMTHEMVAWAIGFPADRRPLSELYRLSSWSYDDQPANNYYVEFGSDGRVRHFGRTNP
jgi:hypothetical protein